MVLIKVGIFTVIPSSLVYDLPRLPNSSTHVQTVAPRILHPSENRQFYVVFFPLN